MKNRKPVSTKDRFYFKSVDEYKRERYMIIVVTSAIGVIGFCASYIQYIMTMNVFWIIILGLSLIILIMPIWVYNKMIDNHIAMMNKEFINWLKLHFNLVPYGEITFMQGRQSVMIKQISEVIILHMKKPSDEMYSHYLELNFDSDLSENI